MANRDLADYYRHCGLLQEALKCYQRTRDFCSTAEHVMDMCLSVIEVGHSACYKPLERTTDPPSSLRRARSPSRCKTTQSSRPLSTRQRQSSRRTTPWRRQQALVAAVAEELAHRQARQVAPHPSCHQAREPQLLVQTPLVPSSAQEAAAMPLPPLAQPQKGVPTCLRVETAPRRGPRPKWRAFKQGFMWLVGWPPWGREGLSRPRRASWLLNRSTPLASRM